MRAGGLALVVAVTVLATAPATRAEDPPLVNWPALLPALAPPFTESTFAICADGSPACLDRTLLELRRRIAAHDAACSDNALFARNYRLVTDFYERLRGTGFFQDDLYVAREDAIFAELYFAAEDAWARGEHERVPEAWRIAFGAADEKAVQGAGNLMLGINAHVQRDQPFMIAGLGLVDPEGRSRKADHDKFNELLNTAYDDVIAQAVEWDDPELARWNAPGTQADEVALFQIIAGWREGVWRNAERLVRSQSDEERRLVAESIERNAAEWARWIREEFRYGPGVPFSRGPRDALCARRAERAAAERRALAASQEDIGPIHCAAIGFREVRATVRRRRIAARGRVRCAPEHVRLSIFRATRDGRCRFVTRGGSLGAPRPCRPRASFRLRKGTRFLFRTGRLPRGRYTVRATVKGVAATRRVRVRLGAGPSSPGRRPPGRPPDGAAPPRRPPGPTPGGEVSLERL